MDIEIITDDLELTIFGFESVATNKDYAGTAFKLSGRMWEIVKSQKLKNKGLNIWVYEYSDKVFAGIELEDPSSDYNHGLEKKKIKLEKYAYYKHIGPYNLIRQKGQEIIEQLSAQGFEVVLPYIEIYGHWTNDETKLETELLMCLK